MSSERPTDEQQASSQRVGFLTKLNPSATRASVIRKAVLYALMGPAIWVVCVLFNDEAWNAWPIAPIGLALSGALCGAVCEWQIPKEQDGSE